MQAAHPVDIESRFRANCGRLFHRQPGTLRLLLVQGDLNSVRLYLRRCNRTLHVRLWRWRILNYESNRRNRQASSIARSANHRGATTSFPKARLPKPDARVRLKIVPKLRDRREPLLTSVAAAWRG